MAALAAALTFGIVFWSVWELGQPWILLGQPPTWYAMGHPPGRFKTSDTGGRRA